MIPFFDAHADTIFRCINDDENLRENKLHIDLMRSKQYAPYAQFFAIWTMAQVDSQKTSNSAILPEQLYLGYINTLERMELEFEKNRDILQHCRNAEDAKTAAADGKIAAFISVEGAELLECSEDRLLEAYEAGVRAVNLCWNNANLLCGSCINEADRGLSGEGRSFVHRAQDIGIIIDLSHASEPAFWDTLEISSRPVMTSHSNSKVLCAHPRNLTDEQFKALIRNGGISGINLYSDFLSDSSADIENVFAHIERFMSLGGEKSVVIGSDFDGVERLPEGINGIEDIYKLYELLLVRNYSEDIVRDIFYNNLMYFIERAMK